jgi:hypothetical protein
MEKVVMVGTGDVGAHILEILARMPINFKLIVGDINVEKGQQLVNNALIGAAHHDLHPHFEFRKMDLTDIEGTAEMLKQIQPSVVINCTVMHTWHLIRQLPEELYAKISSAALGAWLPCQVALALNLAKAIKMSEINTHYINTSLSCLTNPVLGKAGYPITIGIGNVDLVEPGVRTLVANKLNINRATVKNYMVAHHQHWVFPREAGYKPGAPYYLKVTVNHKDVTSQFDTDQLMYDGVKLYPPGINFTTVSASSTIKNMLGLMLDQGLYTHSPGPNGLPGGYPVILSAKGAEVVLPDDITLEQAIAMNEKSAYLDGIERIEEDGTVVFADYTYDIMREMIGFDCVKFSPDESFDRAVEMIRKYREFASKHIRLD